MITDHRGKVPNYVITKGHLLHQPSGLSVPLPDESDVALIQAHDKLKKIVIGKVQ